MLGQPGFALGAVLLTALADRRGVGTAMVVGAVALAVAAPLYLPAWRAGRRAAPADPTEPTGAALRGADEAGTVVGPPGR